MSFNYHILAEIFQLRGYNFFSLTRFILNKFYLFLPLLWW